MSGDWTVSTPQASGLDAEHLGAMVQWLDDFQAANIHSILIGRHGRLAFEHYRTGDDRRLGKSLPKVAHGPSIKHDLRSVTKSVTSLLVGIAIDERLIPSVDEPVFGFFPEHADLRTTGKDPITLRHLLTMSAGFEWNEYIPYTDPSNSWEEMFPSPDRWRFVLSRRLVAPPGSTWNYNSGISELLGAILSRASGRPIEPYAREVLFEPLGITDVEWAMDGDVPLTASGLRLGSRDLAKIGQLLLQRGQWGGKQVVSSAWIGESTAPQIGPADRLYFYGYHWWLGRSMIARREISWIAAMGLGGQRLFVVPPLDLVAVITAGHYSDPTIEVWLPLLIFNRYILSAAVQQHGRWRDDCRLEGPNLATN
jgi:CubicO group peptidase (beta-lactamase class C family)